MNLRLTIEYDGAAFSGWAIQPGKRTVEGVVRDALDRVYPGWEGLAAGGRTDAGVHATGQVATVSVDAGPPLRDAAQAVNTALPADVSVVAAVEAPAGFNARYSATSRTYRYIVLTRPLRSALDARRALWWPRPVDHDALTAAASLLPGLHDFTAFTPAETQHRVFVRTVRSATWTRHDDRFHFVITANSFLRHMVRTLVGTMLEGRDLGALLGGAPRSSAGLTAPACGLYLEAIGYADDDLADAFVAGTLDRALTHEEHLRVALTVIRRHGVDQGAAEVRQGLASLWARLGAPERFDPELTERWLQALVEIAVARRSLDSVLRDHPELREAGRFGLPGSSA